MSVTLHVLLRGSSLPSQSRLESTNTGICSQFKTLARSETKDLVYFLWEKVYIRKFCSAKERGFRFKN